MCSPSVDIFAYIHNNPDTQLESVVAPIAAAFERAWAGEVVVAHLREVQVWLGDDPRVIIGGRTVLPGTVFARTFAGAHYDLAVTRALASLGARVVNSPESVALANTKFEAAAALVAAGVPVPAQVLFGSGPSAVDVARHEELGWPRVVKANQGMGGEHVWLADDADEVRTRTDTAGPIRPWVAQQFIREAAGSDVRVLVAAGKVLGSVERLAGNEREFRANSSLPGGTARPADLSAGEHDVAVTAAAAIGATIAGVDLLRSARGPVVTEVNANPALTLMARTLDAPDVYDQVAAAVLAAT